MTKNVILSELHNRGLIFTARCTAPTRAFSQTWRMTADLSKLIKTTMHHLPAKRNNSEIEVDSL